MAPTVEERSSMVTIQTTTLASLRVSTVAIRSDVLTTMDLIGEVPIHSPGNIVLGYPYSGTISGEVETVQAAAKLTLKATLEGLFANRDGMVKIILLLNRILTVSTVTIDATSVGKVIEKAEGVDALANSLSGDNLGETVIQSLASDLYKMVGSEYSLSVLPTEEQKTTITNLVLSFNLQIVYISKMILDVQNRFMLQIGSTWNVKLLQIYIISVSSETFGDIVLQPNDADDTTIIEMSVTVLEEEVESLKSVLAQIEEVYILLLKLKAGSLQSGDGEESSMPTLIGLLIKIVRLIVDGDYKFTDYRIC